MVRMAIVEDLNSLFELEQQFGAEAFTKKALRRFLSKGKNQCYIFEDNFGGIIGSAIVLRRKGSEKARLYSFIIDEKYRNQGVGRQYLRVVLEDVAKKAASITLEVSERNLSAIRMYQSCGFEEVDWLEGYYKDGSAAIKMHRSFQKSG
jgi:ribosomal-protein-alanine N-acetyltransferase